VLTLVLIGIFLIWAAAIWVLVRAVVGVIRAASDQPIANPETWLI